MSQSIDKVRLSTKYEDDAIEGDGEDDVGILEEVLKAVGGAAAKDKEEKEAQKKKEEEERSPEHVAWVRAKDARNKAVIAQADANATMRRADAMEKDKNGPMHIAARKQKKEAELVDVSAKAAEDKAAYFEPQPTQPTPEQLAAMAKPKGMQAYLTPKNVMIAGAGLIGLALVVKLLRR